MRGWGGCALILDALLAKMKLTSGTRTYHVPMESTVLASARNLVATKYAASTTELRMQIRLLSAYQFSLIYAWKSELLAKAQFTYGSTNVRIR